MKIFSKWIILAALLVAALISYGYGFSKGVAIFIVLGVALELVFWVRVLGKKKHDGHNRNKNKCS